VAPAGHSVDGRYQAASAQSLSRSDAAGAEDDDRAPCFNDVDRAEVHVSFHRVGDVLQVQVRDNGTGLPADFSIEATTSLGLSIVRGLVNSQLGGRIEMHNNGGTVVDLTVPVGPPESSDLGRL
jgi:signal transduction histidine kinase